MFGFGALGGMSPQMMAQMTPFASLALGGGNFPSHPANPPAGGQTPMTARPQARPVGMFAAGLPSMSEIAERSQGGRAPRFGGGSMGNPPGVLSLNGGGMDGGMIPSGMGEQGQLPNGPIDMMSGINGALVDNALAPKAKRGPNWQNIGQAVSAGIAGYLAGRGNPAGLAMMQQNFLMQREMADARNRENLERIKAQLPQQVGDSLIVPDGMGGFRTVFRDAQPFEAYAESLGLQPGTPEYMQAVQDYRLGSWSDPALQAKTELEGVRFQNRDALQDQRLDVTRRGQDLQHQDRVRGQDISRDNSIRSTNTSRDNSIRSNETTRGSFSYTHGSGGRGKGRASSGEGQIIVNPSTGQRMQLKGGQWVPIK